MISSQLGPLCVYEKQPLFKLNWDLGEYMWNDTVDNGNKKYGFFQYTIILEAYYYHNNHQKLSQQLSQKW